MKRIRKTLSAILPVFVFVLLSACTARNTLSGEALEKARSHYPYCQNADASTAALPEEFWAKGHDVFAVVELTRDRKAATETMYPDQSVDSDLTTDITTYYFPAKVLDIFDIRDGCSLTEEEITLSFPGLLYDPNIAFEKGQRLVLFAALDESGEAGEVLFEIGPIMSFYLTDDNYVLSLSANPQMDQFSGWKLDALKKEMLRIAEVSGWHQRDSAQG